MDRIIVPYKDSEIVTTIGDWNCEIHFDTLLRKGAPLDGTLFLKNGKAFDILYDEVYAAFTVNGKHGYYVINGCRVY